MSNNLKVSSHFNWNLFLSKKKKIPRPNNCFDKIRENFTKVDAHACGDMRLGCHFLSLEV